MEELPGVGGQAQEAVMRDQRARTMPLWCPHPTSASGLLGSPVWARGHHGRKAGRESRGGREPRSTVRVTGPGTPEVSLHGAEMTQKRLRHSGLNGERREVSVV